MIIHCTLNVKKTPSFFDNMGGEGRELLSLPLPPSPCAATQATENESCEQYSSFVLAAPSVKLTIKRNKIYFHMAHLHMYTNIHV